MSKVAISISVNIEDLMAVEQLAEDMNVSRSSMARYLLRKGIAVTRREAKDGKGKDDA